ncbi:hypothetical protein Cgig2_024696 [Carnegiea gigantea]|uniref:Protein SGT1 homolog n=1 Tax=Carnegiea gigantea TaxID=171969 RepID=A0A9Q1JVJ5_9CARY|nr:hypothetical protein Cgig2_024696 [Carnegiea gigantea]
MAEENASLSELSVDKPTQNAVPARSNIDVVSVVTASAVNGASNAAGAVTQSKPKVRHDFYQKPEKVVVIIFAKATLVKRVTVDYREQILSVTIDIPGEEPYCLQPRLFGKIIPAKFRHEVMSTKIEIRLAKAEPMQWTSLQYTKNVTVAPKINISSHK